MRIRILGTSAAEAWPAVFCGCEFCDAARARGGKSLRSRSGTLIDDDVLIDFSPDTTMHALKYGLKLNALRHILQSHAHEDHFYPSELEMMASPFAHDVAPIVVHGNERVCDAVKRAKVVHSGPNPVECQRHTAFEAVDLGGGRGVTPLPALHARDQECFVLYVTDGRSSFLYGHDSGIYPEATFEFLRGKRLDMITLDCTNGPNKEGTNHMGIPDCVAVRERLLRSGAASEDTRFVLTHFSHNGGLLHEELEELACPLGFEVAYDGAEYII